MKKKPLRLLGELKKWFNVIAAFIRDDLNKQIPEKNIDNLTSTPNHPNTNRMAQQLDDLHKLTFSELKSLDSEDQIKKMQASIITKPKRKKKA